MGAKAMRDAVGQGAIPQFVSLGAAFERSAVQIESRAPQKPERPPVDQVLIQTLGSDVDRYYGTDTASADMQVLWNSSSSLSHGERWFSALTSGHRRSGLADVLTVRSLDAVCSGINTTSLRLLWHVAPPPKHPMVD